VAKNDTLDRDDKVYLLRSLAHHVHRKRELAEVLLEHVETELRGSRRRIYRPAAEALSRDDVLEALTVLGLVGEEAACILGPVIDMGDHRMVSGALSRLADYAEQNG
jgi:hypothetical protein